MLILVIVACVFIYIGMVFGVYAYITKFIGYGPHQRWDGCKDSRPVASFFWFIAIPIYIIYCIGHLFTIGFTLITEAVNRDKER